MVTGEFTGTELVDADKKTVGKGAEPPPPPPPHEIRMMIVKNNEMYRIGDVFKISKYNQISNHKLCTAILNNEKYDNTILKIYLLELVNPKYNNKLDVLINVINEYRLVNKIKHYDENFSRKIQCYF